MKSNDLCSLPFFVPDPFYYSSHPSLFTPNWHLSKHF